MSTEVNRDELAECYQDLVRATRPNDLLNAITLMELALTTAREAVVADMMLDPTSRASYASIGAVLGITRQGARKRYERVVLAEMRRRARARQGRQDADPAT
jgi:hypothetical protein